MSASESNAPGSTPAILSGLPDDALLDEGQSAIHLGVSKRVLQTMRKEGIGPVHVSASDGARYRKGDLDAWQRANKTGMPIKKS